MGANRIIMRQVAGKLPDMEAAVDKEAIRPRGCWEEFVMPDTIDIAEHARLAVNALTNLGPDDYYALTQGFRFGQNPPVLSKNWACMPKYLRALPLMRAMSGSEQNLEVEENAMRTVLNQIGTDGQLYFPIGADGPPAGTSYPATTGITVQAMVAWYERDRNLEWLKWIKILSDGLKYSAIVIGDYSYIPPECSLSPDGEWHWTLRGAGNAPGYLPYTLPAEPVHDSQGQEGAVKFENCCVVWGLVAGFNLTGDAEALEHAARLARFCRKPTMWSHDTEEQSTPPNEHGIFTGHFHGNVSSLIALLKLAIATDDMPLKQLVREGYEHARRHGVIRLGFLPSWIKPLMGRRKFSCLECNEGCGAANFVILGVHLSTAGLGDYWDDVDSMVRNHFIELQMTDLALMRKAGAGNDHDDTLKGFIGGFTQTSLTVNHASTVYGCCTGNGSRALFYAWEGITRFDGRTATVNLFLNRVSPWMDIASYLPYEGRVELTNKKAECAGVRIPGWVDPTKITCDINGRKTPASKSGNYLLFTGLKPGDKIALQFPVGERVERYTIGETTYTATMRGSTVVAISNRMTDLPEHANKYPLFAREHMKAQTVSMKKSMRFVADRLPAIF